MNIFRKTVRVFSILLVAVIAGWFLVRDPASFFIVVGGVLGMTLFVALLFLMIWAWVDNDD